MSGTSEFSTCLEVNALINLFPTPLDLLTRDSGSLDIQLSRPAGPGDMTVNLTTSDATIATVPTTVVIPEGELSRSVTVTTGTTAGTATIGATANQFHASTGQVMVTLRPMTLTAPGPLVGVGHTLPGTVTLTQAAPAGGVTVALTSGDTGLVSVPASVFIPQGGDSVSFLITGVAVGSTTISSSADGFEPATLPIESTAIAVVTLGSGVVAPGLNTSLALSIGIPAPPGGVTVTLSSSDASIVSVVTPTVFIPEGLQIPAVNPVVHGVAIGTAQITATTPTLAPDTAPVNVTLSTGFAPNPLTIIEGQTGEITLSVSAPAPAGGLTFSTSIANTAFASVAPTAHIAAGSTSVQLVVTGVAVGSTTIRATAAGIADTTAAIVVTDAPPINLGNVTVGQNLQATLSGSLGAPAPAGNRQVTVTSQDPTKVLLATSATAVGTASITLEVGAGTIGIPTFYVQALAGVGTVQLTATASGYASDTSDVTLTPSGFMFPVGTANISTTTFSNNTALNVVAARLNPIDLTFGQGQEVRGGLTVNVPIVSSNTVVGVLVDTGNDQILIDHLTFNGGDSSASADFDPKEIGTATISLSVPVGFSTPSHLRQITASVTGPPINLGNVTVGHNLQTTLSGSLGAPAPAGNRQVTVTSQDPTKVLLATSATAVGTASITLDVGAGTAGIPAFYVQALAGAGSVQLTTTASGYAPDTSDVTLTPSGFMFAVGTSNISTTTFSTNTALNVVAARLNPADLTFAQGQEARGGLTVNVPIVSSNTVVGVLVDTGNDQILIDHLTFNGGDSSAGVDFDPKEGGTTSISLSVPAGFSTPSHLQQITATVTAPPINLGNVTVGHNLQTTLSGSLGAPAPAGNRQVTVTSQDPTKVLLATSATALGAASITLDVGAGTAGIPAFYVQALAGAGTVQLETTASGYATDTSLVTLTPSGFTFSSGSTNFSTTTFSPNTALTVVAVRLNPGDLTFAQGQELRSGHPTVNVFVTSSVQTVGTIVNSPAVFEPGDSSASLQFDPAAGGNTTISIGAPAGFTTPSNLQQLTGTVTAPNITVSGSGLVGRDLQTSISLSLGATPPSRLDVTVTSNNPAIATITKTSTAAGDGTLIFEDVPATLPGTSIGTFFLQGRSLGTTTLTVQAPGYNGATINVTVQPSGFAFTPGTGNIPTTTFSTNTTVTVVPARLDPATLNVAQVQPLRGGHPTVDVAVTSSLTTVGTIVGSPAVFDPAEPSVSVQFDPAGGGATTVSLVPPAGFTTPSNLQQITATVTAPNITVGGSGLVGLDLQTSISLSLGVAPPSRLDVTVTSNNPAIATITKTSTAAGDGTLIFEDVPATLPGTSIGTIFLQGRSLGTTTLTVQAPGYNDATINVTVQPSGFAFSPGTTNFSTTPFSANTTLTVVSGQLDPATLNYLQTQALRGGHPTVNVSVTSSLSTVGTILNSPAIFDPTDASANVQFDPVGGGATTVSLVPPAGFTPPSNLQQITATVTAPNITVSGSGFVGRDLQTSVSLSLGVAPPSRRDVTVTSNNPAIATITTTAADEGTATVTFTNVPATLPGTSVGTFFLQGRSIGTTTLTVQAPGYNDATFNVTVQPSGFAFTPGTTNFSMTTSASDRTLTVQPFRLDPTFLTVLGAQALRGGLGPLDLSVTSSLTTVGTILGSPAIFDGGGPLSKSVQFHPVAVGSTIIAIEQPAGFTTPSNLQQITATVNALVGGVVELDRQMSITALAGRVAPSDHADALSVRVRPSAFSFRLGAIR